MVQTLNSIPYQYMTTIGQMSPGLSVISGLLAGKAKPLFTESDRLHHRSAHVLVDGKSEIWLIIIGQMRLSTNMSVSVIKSLHKVTTSYRKIRTNMSAEWQLTIKLL